MAKGSQEVRIFSALEVANICGVVNQTAINWIRNGHLKAFTTPGGQYRVYAEDLKEFLNARGMRLPEELAGHAASNIHWDRALVIDDDRQFNDIVKEFIITQFPGISPSQAFDGFDAGRLINENRPGFIILDIDLPGIDGHALCRRIKEDPSFGKPFVVAVTGHGTQEERERILKDGADAFLAKPFDMKSFVSIMSEFNAKVSKGGPK